MIPDEVIDQVRARADILEIVGETVQLKRAGAAYKGLCPFHGEKTPSFTVNPHQGTYHCFGCQAHGDSLKFIRETQHLNFPEAVRALAARVGVEVPEDRAISPRQRKARAQKRALEDRLFDAQEKLTVWYEQLLTRSPAAQTYLRQRQISSEAASAFRLGWAPNDVGATVRWMHQHEISLRDLETLGVVIPYDPSTGYKRGDSRLDGGRLRFRDRLMCPIFDLRDRVIGFSGRVIDPQQKIAKYLNSPETPLFTKGNSLFGLKTARVAMSRQQSDDLILCEGNLDVVMLWQAGFPNSVAAMGTAVTETQATLLKRLTRSVICVMDGDAAGQKAAFKSLPILLSQGLDVRGRPLPQGHDPDSFIKEHGAASFRGWLKGAQPLILERLKVLLDEHPRDPIGQAKIASELVSLVSRVESEEQRPLFLDVIARELEVSRSYLSDLLLQASATKSQNPQARSAHKGSKRAARPATYEARGGVRPTQDAPYLDSYEGGGPHEMMGDLEQLPPEAYEAYGDSSPLNEPYDADQVSPHDQHSNQHRDQHRDHKRGSKKDERQRPWWTEVSIERGGGRAKPRRFGERPTGDAQLSIESAPEPPPRLHLSDQDISHGAMTAEARALLSGYEREAVSFLFYHPELIERFLESDGGELFAHPEVKAFLMSLKAERDQGLFVSGELYLSQSTQESIVAVLRDCIASPPPPEEKINAERKLGDLMRRLKRGRLQADLVSTTRELQLLSQETALDSAQLEELQAKLLARYQELQAHLNTLSTAHLPRSS